MAPSVQHASRCRGRHRRGCAGHRGCAAWPCRCRPPPAGRIRAPRWPHGSSSRRCPTPPRRSCGRSATRSGSSPGRRGCRHPAAARSRPPTSRRARCLRPRRAKRRNPSVPSKSRHSSAVSQASRLSRVMPHSITMAGSSMISGTGPSAGGVSFFAQAAMAARRSATIAGQCCWPARRRAGRPGLHQVDDRATSARSASGGTHPLPSRRSRARASSAPNSRILLKNRFVYQCSQ